MPQTADDELVRRDTRVPGLRTLLNPDAVLEMFDSLLPADVERPVGVDVRNLRYHPGTGLDSGLAVHYPNGVRHAFARAFATGEDHPGISEEVRYAQRWTAQPREHTVDLRALQEPRLRGPLHDPALGLVIGPPVDDRALPSIRHFATAPHGFTAADGGSVHTLAYRPGRGWTGVVHDPAGRPVSVVRARSGNVRAAAYLAPAIAGLAVPDLVKVSRYGLLVTQWVPGEPLDRFPAGGRASTDSVLTEAGRLLARLHSVPPPRELPPVDMRDALTAAASEVGALLPQLAERAAAVASDCADALAALPAFPVLVHGGFRAEQVLVGERGLTLIDLDRTRTDHPATDLGDFAAAEFAAGRGADDPAAALGPLLDGYLGEASRELASQARRGLGAATAAALLRRAVAPFRYRVPHWDERIAELVTAAERTLRTH